MSVEISFTVAVGNLGNAQLHKTPHAQRRTKRRFYLDLPKECIGAERLSAQMELRPDLPDTFMDLNDIPGSWRQEKIGSFD